MAVFREPRNTTHVLRSLIINWRNEVPGRSFEHRDEVNGLLRVASMEAQDEFGRIFTVYEMNATTELSYAYGEMYVYWQMVNALNLNNPFN